MTKPTTTTPAPTPSMKPLPWVGVKAFTNREDDSSLSLVLLRDLVRWLMQSKGVAFMGAARELHGALHERADLRLYVTADSGAARVVGATDTFGLSSVQRRIYSRGIGSGRGAAPAPASLPSGVAPGMSAALHYVGKGWGSGVCPASVLDDNNNPASGLAMPCELAAEIWGGVATLVAVESLPLTNAEPTTWGELVPFRKNNSKSDWTRKQKNIVASEAKTRKNSPGAKGVATVMAEELGISVSRLNDLIKTEAEPGMREKKRSATA